MTPEQLSAVKSAAEKYGCTCLENRPLSEYTTFGIGGKCPLIVEINGSDALMGMLPMMRENNIPFYVIGKGSNILADDRDIPIVILHIGKDMAEISVNDRTIICGAGAQLAAVSRAACENSLTGLEFAFGIPGNIGGAVFMNAGAYGGEMKDIAVSVTAVGYDGVLRTFTADELDFGYRHSIFSKGGYVIVSAELRLDSGNKNEITAKMNELTAKRREKQPLEYRSAGSTFKRPQGTFAALLIEQCGLKGYSCGDAQVSEKHSGFVVNKGKASFDDVMNVINHVKKTVFEASGIMLECEPEIIRAEK